MLQSTMKYTHFDISLIAEDREDADKLIQYYPVTFAEGVYIEPTHTYTVKDHIADITHLTPREKKMLRRRNKPHGVVVLDDGAKIPASCFSEHQLFLHFEYDTLDDMLEKNDYTDADKGHLVMVKDCYNGKQEDGLSCWVVYRFLGGDNRNVENWQPLFREFDMDIHTVWDKVKGRPCSYYKQIDAMVRKAHRHEMDLDQFHDEDGKLYYGDKQIMYKNFSSMYTSDDHLTMDEGDVVVERTATFITETDESPEVLEGVCDNKFENSDFRSGPVLNMRKVTSAVSFFEGSANLLTIPAYRMIDCKDISRFAANCTSLMTLMIKAFPRVVNASYMFSGCNHLKELPSLIFPLLENAEGFLEGCELFENSKTIIADNLISIKRFAKDCKSLVRPIPFNSLEIVGDASEIYMNCKSLKAGSLYTPNADNVSYAFYGCKSLTRVDLNIAKATNTDSMFYGCKNLVDVSIVEGGLSTDLNLNRTKVSRKSIEKLIENLPEVETNKTISIKSTPAAKSLSSEEFNLAKRKNWTIII